MRNLFFKLLKYVFFPLHSQIQVPSGNITNERRQVRSCSILDMMEYLHLYLSKQQLVSFTTTDTVLQKSAIPGPEMYLLILTTIKQLCTQLRPQQRTCGVSELRKSHARLANILILMIYSLWVALQITNFCSIQIQGK